MEPIDILITNGKVLTLDADRRCIPDGYVAIRGDSIVALGEAGEWPGGTAARVVDAQGGIVMPGLINTHTHAAMTCFRGLADDLPLMIWLNEHIFPAEAKLDAQKVYAGALLACAEMVLAGITCFCDMYLFEGAVAEAARTAAIRAVVGEVLYDFPSPHYGPLENGFAYTEELIETYHGDPLIRVAVEPHSPYLCAADLLQRAAAISETHGIPLVIHVAETEAEVRRSFEEKGCSPVAYLADLGVLSPRTLACHCVFLSPEDMALLRRFDVKVSHNPESNMKLASGIAPVPDLLQNGVCVGLGTDGCASNNNLDLLAEMDTAAKLHKAARLDPVVMDAETTVRMATIEGARALGMDDLTGSLEPGKRADIIVIDTQKPHAVPMYSVYSHLVYAAKAGDVRTAIIDGRLVMSERRVLSLDTRAAMDAVQRIAHEIKGG